MDGRVGALGKFSEEGDGKMAVRRGCGACIGDCGGMKADPDDDVWCDEFSRELISPW
jgi:hypothetical protein